MPSQESLSHLLTVLRGRMQEFEAIDDGEAQMKPWNDMLEYLTSWVEEDREIAVAAVQAMIHEPMTRKESYSLKLKARNEAFREVIEKIKNLYGSTKSNGFKQE